MTNSAPLQEAAEDQDAQAWQVAFAPDALPETPGLTVGQRRVLQACVQLFAEQGFAGSSVRDIAARAGLQPASLYNHFASKDAMLTTLVLIGHGHHADQLLRAVLDSSGAAEDQMRSLVRAHVRVHCEYSRLALVVNREDGFLPSDVRQQVTAIRDRSGKITTDIVERGAELGVFTPVGLRATLLALAGLGLDAARWFPYQSEISVDELSDNYAVLALRMLGCR
ncbi:MAG: TetR family transcriptional regulator [Frankiales bacterium]|nr:TetR family transcriptional regulator [Frankiales bacterium]